MGHFQTCGLKGAAAKVTGKGLCLVGTLTAGEHCVKSGSVEEAQCGAWLTEEEE